MGRVYGTTCCAAQQTRPAWPPADPGAGAARLLWLAAGLTPMVPAKQVFRSLLCMHADTQERFDDMEEKGSSGILTWMM